jgi:pilin isopeptide linkage protein/LPXTG-motif cell wall-anchored protein
MFTFTVMEGNEFIFSSANQGGSILFKPIEYTAPGAYTYAVTENRGAAPGITYDPQTVYVTVNVTQNADGSLTAVQANPIAFVNYYAEPPRPPEEPRPEPTATPNNNSTNNNDNTPTPMPTPTPTSMPTATPDPTATPSPSPAPTERPVPTPYQRPTETPLETKTPAEPPVQSSDPPPETEEPPAESVKPLEESVSVSDDNAGPGEPEASTAQTIEEVALLVTEAGNTLEAQDDGTFIEFNLEGTPLGSWKQDENGMWVFEEIPLRALEMPKTGETPVMMITPGAGLLLLAAGVFLNRKRNRKKAG